MSVTRQRWSVLAGEPLHNLGFETHGSFHHNASTSCNKDYLSLSVPWGLCLLSILRSSVMWLTTSALDMCIANKYCWGRPSTECNWSLLWDYRKGSPESHTQVPALSALHKDALCFQAFQVGMAADFFVLNPEKPLGCEKIHDVHFIVLTTEVLRT